MLLTISTTYQPATDLGYLLYKHPDQMKTFELSFGRAHVFYPESSVERCTAALLLDVDPVGLVRGKQGRGAEGHTLDQYVNDRPYVASSFLSVAIAEVFGSALAGKSKERQTLAETAIAIEAEISCLPCRGGEAFLRRLFEPLGYEIETTSFALNERFPDWGQSQYLSVRLKNTCCLRDLLTHLYVLMPVLDADKHYFVGGDEVEKLLRHGKNWLSAHPERDLITNRYLLHKRHLTRDALARLSDEDEIDPDANEENHAAEEAVLEEKISLNEQRIGAVISVLRKAQARRVIDLGCGEGRLLKSLMEQKDFDQLLGVDVSHRALEIAERRLRLDDLNEKARQSINLIQGSLTYRDKRMAGYDAATCIEVIEHMDQPRLSAFERVLFEFAKPQLIVLTTPNSEYNCKFASLPAGKFRHKDHRFEWTRAEFRAWADAAAKRHGYSVTYLPVGPDDSSVGSPTQMGVFAL